MTPTPTGSRSDQPATDWSADRLAALIRYESVRLGEELGAAATPAVADDRRPWATSAPQVDTTRRSFTLHELSIADHEGFVDTAYLALLGRAPTPNERVLVTSQLMRGDPKIAILGQLRYGSEGRVRAVRVPGLLPRHLAQRAFRLPVAGYLLRWLVALLKLPGALRYARSALQTQAGRVASLAAELEVTRVRESSMHVELNRLRADQAAAGTQQELADARHSARILGLEQSAAANAEHIAGLGRALEEAAAASADRIAGLEHILERSAATNGERIVGIERTLERSAAANAERLVGLERALGQSAAVQASQAARVTESIAELQMTATWVRPQGLPEVLEIVSDRLTRPESNVSAGCPLPSADARYVEFERVFYESHVVARKQRIYLPYIDRALASSYPILDLGCGRGEFMEILRGEGIESVGVDLNGENVVALQRAGHVVHEADLLTFLARDAGIYAGAVCLQVVEHLVPAQFERLLELLHPRLAPGASLIIESVNPHSPFALGNFHMDPTHVAPVPPERVRFYMELAGFGNARTLLQAPIPANAFGGPERRAHYCDYAVIGYRS